MTGLFESLVLDTSMQRMASRKALALANTRAQNQFSSFLGDNPQSKFSYIAKDLQKLVIQACQEAGHDDPEAVYNTVVSNLGLQLRTARRPKMCPFHSELTDISLTLGDPRAALETMGAHQFSESSCRGSFAGGCNWKPDMLKQEFWDARQQDADQRAQERDQQRQMAPPNVEDNGQNWENEGGAVAPEYDGPDIDSALQEAPSAVGAPEPVMAKKKHRPGQEGNVCSSCDGGSCSGCSGGSCCCGDCGGDGGGTTASVRQADDKWIQKAVPKENKGLLHKKLDVPESEKIPEDKLEGALHSDNDKLREEAQFAENMKGLHKGAYPGYPGDRYQEAVPAGQNPATGACPECHSPLTPEKDCPNCGWYPGASQRTGLPWLDKQGAIPDGVDESRFPQETLNNFVGDDPDWGMILQLMQENPQLTYAEAQQMAQERGGGLGRQDYYQQTFRDSDNNVFPDMGYSSSRHAAIPGAHDPNYFDPYANEQEDYGYEGGVDPELMAVLRLEHPGVPEEQLMQMAIQEAQRGPEMTAISPDSAADPYDTEYAGGMYASIHEAIKADRDSIEEHMNWPAQNGKDTATGLSTDSPVNIDRKTWAPHNMPKLNVDKPHGLHNTIQQDPNEPTHYVGDAFDKDDGRFDSFKNPTETQTLPSAGDDETRLGDSGFASNNMDDPQKAGDTWHGMDGQTNPITKTPSSVLGSFLSSAEVTRAISQFRS